MTVKKASAASSNKKVFYDGKYKIAASPKSEGIVIYRRQEDGGYKSVDTVSGTNDNYRAAIKRIRRMYERDLRVARVSESINRITQASRKRAVEKPKPSLEQSVRDSIERFSQATFKLDSNISGVSRRYMIRSSTKKGRVTTVLSSSSVLELCLIQSDAANTLIPIAQWGGTKATALGRKDFFAQALACAKEDAMSLRPTSVVVMAHTDHEAGETGSFSVKRIAYLSEKESVTHLQDSLKVAIDRFFLRLTGNGAPTKSPEED